VTASTDTPSWQLALLPSVPEYWRCTPTEHGPYDERAVMPRPVKPPFGLVGVRRLGAA